MPWRPLLDLLFPPLCHACKASLPVTGANRGSPRPLICAECIGKISFLTSPLCAVCGAPFATENGGDHTCGACLSHTPFHACRSAAVLSPLQDLIHRFKYGGKIHLADPLALLAFHHLNDFLEEAARQDIVVNNLIAQRFANKADVAEAEVRKYYEDNKLEQFTQGDRIKGATS